MAPYSGIEPQSPMWTGGNTYHYMITLVELHKL